MYVHYYYNPYPIQYLYAPIMWLTHTKGVYICTEKMAILAVEMPRELWLRFPARLACDGYDPLVVLRRRSCISKIPVMHQVNCNTRAF
jgi:hypothetical protein